MILMSRHTPSRNEEMSAYMRDVLWVLSFARTFLMSLGMSFWKNDVSRILFLSLRLLADRCVQQSHTHTHTHVSGCWLFWSHGATIMLRQRPSPVFRRIKRL